MELRVENYREEIAQALDRYNRYVVCLEKPTEKFQLSLVSLLNKAIKAFGEREAGLRHGVALDSHVTVILSEVPGKIPLCGIYFNLHTPYWRNE